MKGYKVLGKRLKVEFKQGEADDVPSKEASIQKMEFPDIDHLVSSLMAKSLDVNEDSHHLQRVVPRYGKKV